MAHPVFLMHIQSLLSGYAPDVIVSDWIIFQYVGCHLGMTVILVLHGQWDTWHRPTDIFLIDVNTSSHKGLKNPQMPENVSVCALHHVSACVPALYSRVLPHTKGAT